MKYRKVLVVTDNHSLFRRFKLLLEELNVDSCCFEFCCTSKRLEILDEGLRHIDIKKQYYDLIGRHDLILSLHCKQIFPIELVRKVKCINIHPGFNPYNRGWFPQVFSIINKLPAGATIHEMDEHIDHGNIIVQKEVAINSWETSSDVYLKILDVEMELIRNCLLEILNDTYISKKPFNDGNYNSINDFNQLREINLESTVKVGVLIDLLRALTHGDFNNAYFKDPVTGEKIFIKIQLQKGE